ncbi:MAG: GTPase [Paucimonas sp.]|nr:GTPase [Paucimonas sp.]
MAEPAPLPTTLVIGAGATEREQAIATAIASLGPGPVAVLLEGLPNGKPILEEGPGLQVVRSAAGCLCCSGNLVMTVTLNRILRKPPAQLYIGVASAAHLDALQRLLRAEPYTDLLQLKPVIRL